MTSDKRTSEEFVQLDLWELHCPKCGHEFAVMLDATAGKLFLTTVENAEELRKLPPAKA